jgi:hypothetical protein
MMHPHVAGHSRARADLLSLHCHATPSQADVHILSEFLSPLRFNFRQNMA